MADKLRRVEIFGGHPGRGNYLPLVYDQREARYLAPQYKEPGQWVGRGVVTAILDSGMLLDHPLIKRNLVRSVDFTGEGPNDLNGHGTMVTLLGLREAPEMDVINVKILDEEGFGQEENFIQGIEWCIEHRNEYRIQLVNLSAGVYHKKWGIFDCKGDCDLCHAVQKANFEDITIVAAAGNEGVNEIPCPQKALLNGAGNVVGAINLDTQVIPGYSGRPTLLGPEAVGISMVPVRDPD